MVVIESNGSSPGRMGFKMAVSEDKELSGSVGGGAMEYSLVEVSKKLFNNFSHPFLIEKEHGSDDTKKSSGMLCSGSQKIAFYLLDDIYKKMVDEILNKGEGQLLFSENSIDFNTVSKLQGSKIESKIKWLYVEEVGFKEHLVIFGAGHVSLELSKLFIGLDFHISLYDNRNANLSTFKNNTYAHQRKIINYNDVAAHIPDKVYAVIMTFAHKDDSKILEQLLGKNLKYLGMMGSPEKVKTIFEELLKKEVPAKLLETVDAPIGLPINSHTPAEISISIAAKIISIKNR